MLQRAISLAVICVAFASCAGDGIYNPNAPTARTNPSPAPSPITNYAGNWSGTYTVTGCNQSGGVALANLCAAVGTTAPYSFSLTQGGQNVSGTFALGSITFPNTGGTVAKDGSLVMSATNVSNGITTIVTWALQFTGSTIIGTITENYQSSTLSGSATIVGTTNNASHANPTSSVNTEQSPLDIATRRLHER